MSAASGKQWAILVPCLLVIVSFFPLFQIGEARTTKEFSNGQKEMDLEFPTGTESYIVNITIPRSANLSSAQIGITGLPLGSVMTYPRSPQIDMGNDGTVDWVFSGPGYGSFGRQQVLLDNIISGTIIFHGSDTNSSLSLRLPADAKVVTASMRMTGQAHADNWWNQSWLFREPVTVMNNKAVTLGEVVVDLWVDTSNFTVRDINEFRVFYRPTSGPIEERPSQVVDTRMVSGLILESRVIFRT